MEPEKSTDPLVLKEPIPENIKQVVKEHGPEEDLETKDVKSDNQSQEPSETVETVKNDSFWDKYKHYLLIIAFVSLLYFAYMYYWPECNFSQCVKKPLEPFHEPIVQLSSVAESVAETVVDTVSSATTEVANSAKSVSS
jgi:hypothetical protein